MSRRERSPFNWIRKQAEKWSGAISFKAIIDVVHFSCANSQRRVSRYPAARLRGRECTDGTQAIQSAQAMPPEQR